MLSIYISVLIVVKTLHLLILYLTCSIPLNSILLLNSIALIVLPHTSDVVLT